ncbi:MAG: DUF721 domain-containing protein [Gammaproteobacteria bacterium]|nr:DciA family protein [Gammaproteobacteria bacterium]MXX95450.1 DUF721 domain-containing protein [Gammaproteobacteria bacterium]MYF52271.1 DUF721 domain-containing protein [Gammaproteobacteria bacterium]MYK43198.1 DUF721 domain-containing protein [Gammaproteobacteria bacterium]
MSSAKYYHIKESLQPTDKRKGKFQRLINRLHSHQSLKQIVKHLLPEEEAEHCVGTHVRGSTLTIIVDSSSWGNRIRFTQMTLLSDLRKLANFAHIQRIVVITDSRQQFARN